MVGEWIEVPFPEVIDFQEGPGILARDFREGGVPLVRLAGLERGASLLAGCNYLDPDVVAKRWAHFALKKGDILLSSSASLGRIAVVGDDGIGAIPYTGIIRMRSRDERLVSSFIRYLLEGPHFQQQAEMVGVGSVIRHFGPMHLRQMTVSLPPPNEQRAIAHILGTIDDKIELNRRMNQTLEAIARAIFKSWFVDFDPVRAKMDGRQPFGMDAETAVLFPDVLTADEDGEIPEGWRSVALSKVASVTMGQSPPGESYNESGDGLPFYQGTRDFGTRFPRRRVYCSAPTRIARAGSVLVSVRAPVGELNIASETCAIGRGLAAITENHGRQSFLHYSMLARQAAWEKFEAGGTVFGSASKADVNGFQITLPASPLIERFETLARPLDDLIRSNEKEIATLAAIRDALLPKLLSGEIRVREAERVVGTLT